MSSFNTLLAFDTASNCGSITLKSSDKQWVQNFEGQRRHSNCLLDSIQTLLKQANVSIQDCDAIIIGNGPGSFMGVRLAHAVGQALCLPNHSPLITLSSLQLQAQAAYLEHGAETIAVIQDARKHEIYLGEYSLQNGVMHALSADKLCTPNQLSIKENIVTAVGNGLEIYKHDIPDKVFTQVTQVNNTKYSLADAAIDIVVKQPSLLTTKQAEPNYVRNHVADLPKSKDR